MRTFTALTIFLLIIGQPAFATTKVIKVKKPIVSDSVQRKTIETNELEKKNIRDKAAQIGREAHAEIALIEASDYCNFNSFIAEKISKEHISLGTLSENQFLYFYQIYSTKREKEKVLKYIIRTAGELMNDKALSGKEIGQRTMTDKVVYELMLAEMTPVMSEPSYHLKPQQIGDFVKTASSIFAEIFGEILEKKNKDWLVFLRN